MKKYFLAAITLVTFAFTACTNSKEQGAGGDLSANEFSEKVKQTENAQLIDVRTPGEFEKGHLQNAKNFDWNGDNFQGQTAALDKSKPVFVYCLSGGRSSSAAGQLRADGFKEVYELNGGIMKWRAASLPESTDNTTASTGMSKQQFDALLTSDKMVLIDFYADWCQPCKKMAPSLEEISKEMSDKVQVIRINADDNQALCNELKIDALPHLQLYKNKMLSWSNSGFLEKEAIVKALN